MSIEAKRRDSVTNAFLRLRCDGVDCFPKFLKSVAMIRIYAGKVFVNCFGFSPG